METLNSRLIATPMVSVNRGFLFFLSLVDHSLQCNQLKLIWAEKVFWGCHHFTDDAHQRIQQTRSIRQCQHSLLYCFSLFSGNKGVYCFEKGDE